MKQNRLFINALLISFFLHAGLVVFLSIKKAQLKIKPQNKIDVSYQRIKEVQQEQPKAAKIKKIDLAKEDQKTSHQVDILSKKNNLPEMLDPTLKDVAKFDKSVAFNTKEMPSQLSALGGERKIDVPVLKSEKITNPKYLSYNDTIRQKIRQRAYIYIDNPDFESGEVYLTFVVFSNGTLSQVKVIEEKTHASEYIKNIGIRSIQESSPFPSFPKDLNYPELTFNVVISFKLNK